MNEEFFLRSVVMILCCIYAECNDVKANLGETMNFTAEFGKSAQITCINSGAINQADQRQWYENTNLIINDGTLANSNSGYSESLGSNSFTLNTPAVNYSFVGYKYTCRYVFQEAYFYLTAVVKPASTEACTGAFECGFCPILIVVVSSVIICILMWKEVPKRIGGFSTVKIVIIVIFSVVAIGIGLGLGLGLREGEENCLNCGAIIGISISLGVALSVMQFAIIFNCNNEKGCKDSKGVTSDRSNGDRARTPTSASGVTMEAKKKSLNKPTEKGTEVSSLNTKPVGHPLPETPNGRKNQLEPISVEVDNSAREKKKKKKKKEKKEASEELQF